MRIVVAGHKGDVEHVIQPYLRMLLEEYDAVIVSPYMGVSQYQEFGEKVIVDCQDYLGLFTIDGKTLGQTMAGMAEALGLSTIRCMCPHTPEPQEKREA